MAGHEGERWDVSIKNNAIYLERISDSDEQLFDDSLAVDEARGLAGLLRKFADKLEGSGDSGGTGDSGDSDESDASKASEGSEKPSGQRT
ncbi:hypothetical protein [Mycobacterium sherrisii]|uniref:Uncharacterized protein n=1 Tax=Mycobacterium sherrisii TaxID=243061 RepID=A0A1E3SXJ9_9MYCO|nr:hypothetical protein [Mycobacterium sherrisii]MCV7029640.1 hypothetical protein [Mycobacterium sherrisii]ODR06852.1 hypothetical protein BHQ21_10685 [Mycobacterium sherrisii]ORW83550.1 hypothetical protein AWC25_25410 [Mycobacterium sherrisii]